MKRQTARTILELSIVGAVGLGILCFIAGGLLWALVSIGVIK